MGDRDVCFGIYSIAAIIRVIVAVFLDRISLLAHRRYLGLACFGSLDALVPRVLKFCVASSPALSEPRTAASATTQLAGILDGTTLEAQETDGRRCG